MNAPQALGYVYAIENTVNNRCYIGSAKDYKSRWHTHRSSLRRGKHHSFILQRAWNKYGEKVFVFKVLLICSASQRIEYENRLMPLQSYNVLRTAKEKLVRGGWKHTKTTREKMSAAHKGKKFTDAHRENMAQAARKREYNDTFREKARQRQIALLPFTKDMLREAGEKARKLKSTACVERVRAAHACVMTGTSVSEACKQNKVTQETFYKYVKELGLCLVGHKNRLNKLAKQKAGSVKAAYEAIKAGLTIEAACKQNFIGSNTLYRYIKKMGLVLPDRQNRKLAI